MRLGVCFLTMLVCAAGPAGAATILYQGTFSADNQVQEFVFTVAAPTTITLETFGYSGGTVGAITVPGGGFYPTIALFTPLEPTLPIVSSLCAGSASADCIGVDAYLQQVVGPGTYTVALMVNDNYPTGGPGDPFAQDGNPGFTCVEAGVSGTFCDLAALGESRTGDWALAITGADSSEELSQTPEPEAVSLAGIGMALVALLARRREVLNRRIQ